MSVFDIRQIAFTALGYNVSWVELIGTLFGIISVYYASRANILTWGTGVVNELFLFILFFQVQLYADMVLQVYFFVVSLYGWYNWKKSPASRSINTLTGNARIMLGLVIIVGSILFGFFFKNIHLYMPTYFVIPAAYPYTDSLVMVLSISATVLLAGKKIENWYLWSLVDLLCIVLYAKKGIYFLFIEYSIFFCMAVYGVYNWHKQLRSNE